MILRTSTASLTSRCQEQDLSRDSAKQGGALSGNGHLNSSPDGTTMIVPAINVQDSTSDLDLVGTQLMSMKWQQGSTNMVQGLALADAMPWQGGQPHAPCTVLVLSNGKHSFKYQTEIGTAACMTAELDDFFNGKEGIPPSESAVRNPAGCLQQHQQVSKSCARLLPTSRQGTRHST